MKDMNPQLLARVVERLRALADENRVRLILRLKAGPANVTTLCAELDIAQASVSKHLAVLKDAGLVTADRIGTQAIYRIHDASVFELCDLVCAGVHRHVREQQAELQRIGKSR